METSRDFERAIRARHNLTSDYQLAKLLGVKPSTISAHRTGDAKTFGEQIGYRIAELLELDAGYVLACLAAERSKDIKVKKVWQRLAELTRVAIIAPVLFAVTIASSALVTPSPAHAAPAAVQCILCQVARRWLATLALLLGLSATAQAGNGDWSLQVNGQSWHAPNGVKYNQNNWGLGVEYEQQIADRWQLRWSAGGLINSLNEQSWYAGSTLTHRWGESLRLEAGVFLGALIYPNFRRDPFAVALPMLSVGTRRAGINFIIVPPIEGIPMAILFQARVGF